MDAEPIAHAAHLVAMISELLQRAASVAPQASRRSDLRYAEALARTLRDQLTAMSHSQAA
jgi:hypothetical protein